MPGCPSHPAPTSWKGRLSLLSRDLPLEAGQSGAFGSFRVDAPICRHGSGCDPGDVALAPGGMSTRRVLSGCCGHAGLTFPASKYTGPRVSPPFSVSASCSLAPPASFPGSAHLTADLGAAHLVGRLPPQDSPGCADARGLGGLAQRRLLPVSPRPGAAPQSAALATQRSPEGQPGCSPRQCWQGAAV